MQPHEKGHTTIVTSTNNTTVLLDTPEGKKAYKYTAVMGQESSQQDVFNECKVNEMIDSALEGYSATIFAYG